MDWQRDVKQFIKEVHGHSIPEYPKIPDKDTVILCTKIIIEEVSETIEAMNHNDIIEVADGIVDSIVVLLDTATLYGIDIQPIWDEVHRTNMLKKGGRLREDGKLLKPEGWMPPEIAPILEAQGQEHKENHGNLENHS